MSDNIIYLTSDIKQILNLYISKFNISTITGDKYKDVHIQNKIDLAIISTKKSNIEVAMKFSQRLDAEVLLMITDDPEQMTEDEIKKIDPILLLPMPYSEIEFNINLKSIIENIRLKEVNCHETTIWFKGILNTIKDAVIAVDISENILFMNPVAQHILGIEELKAIGMDANRVLQFRNTLDEPCTLTEDENEEESQIFEGQIINRVTKEHIRISGNSTKIVDKKGIYSGYLLTFKDIGEINDLFSRINYQSSHDNLTGIFNRKSFINYADQLISLSKYDDSIHGLLLISLDKFKVINDTCGHKAGDELLRKIAYMIKEVDTKNEFVIGRIGGDEFAVLYKNKTLSEIIHYTKAIKRKISKQDFIWGEKEFQIMSSYGIVTITNGTKDHYNLLASADDAIAIAKQKGGGKIEVYDNVGIEYHRRRGEMLWIHKLKDAIKNEKFQLFYQEIQGVKNQDYKKIEILIRLENEHGQIVSPIDFIPSAEHYGMMPEIDKIIIEKSIAACREIIENKNITDKYIFSVNISGSSIPDKSLPGFILSVFQKYKVPPTLFCFEITETSAITNMELAESFINNLKRIGCRFSLDDFGSGFSNFAYLRHLDVDYLKIDGSFIIDMLEEPINRQMVESINSIGHIMKMETVAEFVENEDIKNALIEIGVDFLQGYVINKPTPIEQLLK